MITLNIKTSNAIYTKMIMTLCHESLVDNKAYIDSDIVIGQDTDDNKSFRIDLGTYNDDPIKNITIPIYIDDVQFKNIIDKFGECDELKMIICGSTFSLPLDSIL